MSYTGIVIEESLSDTSILASVHITDTRVSTVTAEHKTPWLTQWTMHNIEVPETDASDIAKKLSKALETEHDSWYIDFKNDKTHYIVFPEKVFIVNRAQPQEYEPVIEYGMQLGIPRNQLDFSS